MDVAKVAARLLREEVENRHTRRVSQSFCKSCKAFLLVGIFLLGVHVLTIKKSVRKITNNILFLQECAAFFPIFLYAFITTLRADADSVHYVTDAFTPTEAAHYYTRKSFQSTESAQNIGHIPVF